MTLGVVPVGMTVMGEAVATVNIVQNSQCAGGGHKVITATLSGGQSRTLNFQRDEISAPITDEEIEAFVRVSIRLHKIGKTVSQVETDLSSGFVVTA